MLKSAVGEVHAALAMTWNGDQYERVFPEHEQIDKVKIARAATRMEPNLGILDLRTRVEELVQFIRRSTLQEEKKSPNPSKQ